MHYCSFTYHGTGDERSECMAPHPPLVRNKNCSLSCSFDLGESRLQKQAVDVVA
jgi:hypothetical protein